MSATQRLEEQQCLEIQIEIFANNALLGILANPHPTINLVDAIEMAHKIAKEMCEKTSNNGE